MSKISKKEWIRTLKFLFFSVSAGVIQIVSFTLLDLIPNFDYVFKAYIALTLSVLWNFTLNRNFTFQSASNIPIAMLKTLGFYVIFAPLSIHLADIYLVKTLGWNEILVTACSMIINFVAEFLFQRFFVFGNSIDTNKRAQEKAKLEKKEENVQEKANDVQEERITL